MQYSVYRFIAKCTTYTDYEIFVWSVVLVINLLLVLLFNFSILWSIKFRARRLTTVIMQAPHAFIMCKCDDHLIDRNSFWTLEFNEANLSQGSGTENKGVLNNSSPLDWNWLIVVSENKNTNMSSCEILANQQFSQCLIGLWRTCWSWTMIMNSIIWCLKKFWRKFSDKMNWMKTFHIIYVLSCILY